MEPRRPDPDPFTALVAPHLDGVRAYVERRAPALADDVMSEVGVVAWRRRQELPPGRERAWLFGVARHVLMAERRRLADQAKVRSGQEVDELAASAATSDPGLAPGLHRPLATALARLPERDRELLLLTAWEGLSTAEAARAVGCSPTAARMALVRARRRLAAALDDLDPGWSATRRPARTTATATEEATS